MGVATFCFLQEDRSYGTSCRRANQLSPSISQASAVACVRSPEACTSAVSPDSRTVVAAALYTHAFLRAAQAAAAPLHELCVYEGWARG